MAGELIVLEGGHVGLDGQGNGTVFPEEDLNCLCCRKCETVQAYMHSNTHGKYSTMAVPVVLSDKVIFKAVDDIAIVSPMAPSVLADRRIAVDSGFILANDSGYIDQECEQYGFSITIGDITFATGGGQMTPSAFNAQCVARGLRVVHSGEFLSREELSAMGFVSGDWYVSMVICGGGYVNLILECP